MLSPTDLFLVTYFHQYLPKVLGTLTELYG